MPRAEDRAWRSWLRPLLRRTPRVLLAAQLVALGVVAVREAGWLQPLELAFHDMALRAQAAGDEDARLALVVATEDDIDRFGWPLPDGVLAELVERLLAGGAEVVAVDLYRDRPVGEGAARLAALLAAETRILWAYRLGDAGHRGVAPPAALAGTSRAAFADVVTDAGEVVRRALIAAEDPGDRRVVFSLGAALAMRLSGERPRAAGDNLAFGRGTLRILDEPFGPYARLDAAGYQLLIAYRGGFRRVSVAEAMAEPAALAGRGVVVGMDSLSVRDSFTTPLTTGLARGTPMPGAAIHAHTAAQMLRAAAGRPASPEPLPRLAEHGAVWAAAMLGAAIPLAAPATAWALVSGTATLAALAALLALGTLAHAWLPPAVPAALALALAAILGAWLLEGLGHRQRQRIRRSFEHYLDPRVVRGMLSGEETPSLGGENREITALFTDIAGFTGLAERLPAPQLAELLNAYFEGMAEAIMREGGLVNDFIGDGLVALFGAPVAQPDHAARAVAAAQAADAFARGFAQRLSREGVPFGLTRIGVHTGPALVGNLGTRSRLKYGALGDTLNIAARLESLNRWIGTRILVSGETARAAGPGLRLVGEAVLSGRAAPTALWSPWEADTAEAALYASAVEALRSGDAAAARRQLDALAERRPDDIVVMFHRRRLAEGVCGLTIVPGGK